MSSIIKNWIIDFIAFLVFLIRLFLPYKGPTVLVYHAIRDVKSKEDPNRLSTTWELFQRHIQYLLRKNYRFITPDKIYKFIKRKIKLNNKDILLTFDDGFEEHYTKVVPYLNSFNIKGLFFVVPKKDKVDFFWINEKAINSGIQLTKKMVGNIASAGHLVGGHGLNHLSLSTSYDAENEIKASKIWIEKAIGKPVLYFAYPFGNANSFIKENQEELKKNGFQLAFSNIMGHINQTDDPFSLKRIRIDWRDTAFRFMIKIKGAYDWLDSIRL